MNATPGSPVFLPEDLIERLATRIAEGLADRVLGHPGTESSDRDGYLNPRAAAGYLGVDKKRIYDLKSMGALVPDGYDGRTPLFRRETIDAYVKSGGR